MVSANANLIMFNQVRRVAVFAGFVCFSLEPVVVVVVVVVVEWA